MNPGQELSSIDFQSMIGGPLSAVVEAQAQAAMTTVNFIKTVGFKSNETLGTPGDDQETGEPINVDFKFKKQIPKEDGTTELKDASLTVPILTMLPIPFIRVEDTEIEFIAKINSVEYKQTDTSMNVNVETQAKAGWLWGSAQMKASFGYQRNTKEGSNVTRDYSLKVKVKAVQDEMPAGLSKVLSILENAIQEKVE